MVTTDLRSLGTNGFVNSSIEIEVKGNATLRSLSTSCVFLGRPSQFCGSGGQPVTAVSADPLSVQFEVLTDARPSQVSVTMTAHSDHNRLENDPNPLNNVVTLILE